MVKWEITFLMTYKPYVNYRALADYIKIHEYTDHPHLSSCLAVRNVSIPEIQSPVIRLDNLNPIIY